tara:strand:- start:1898 stop:2068 length:171 start_codon:yes stop_codon:yes gene_type:complete
MEDSKIALEIDGKRYETQGVDIIYAVTDLLTEAGILEEGDVLELLDRDQDFILHKY